MSQKTTPKKSAPGVQKAPHIKAANFKKPVSKWAQFRSKLPPVFCESTTREDKLCFFSFCCGIILMACLFFADLFIRNYLESRRWEEQVLHTLQMKLDGYEQKDIPHQIDGVIIINQKSDHNKGVRRNSFQKKNNAN